MSFKLASMESFSFDGEEIGAAGAAALRKVRTLADTAPKGRLFAAIATLNELGASTASALERGDLAKAKHVAADLAKAGEMRLPGFFKRKA
jgi:hypothetical protein